MKNMIIFVCFFCVFVVWSQDTRKVTTDNSDPNRNFLIEYPTKEQLDAIKVIPTKPSAFDPKDKGININSNMICQSLKYFAFRAGTNNDATKKYLTSPAACGAATLNFLASTGPSGRPGNNQLFISYQMTDKTWLFESLTCPFYFIRATSLTTVNLDLGPYFSSKFWIQYCDDHIHVKSNFYFGNYWSAGLPLQLSSGATRYMVEFWPEFAWP